MRGAVDLQLSRLPVTRTWEMSSHRSAHRGTRGAVSMYGTCELNVPVDCVRVSPPNSVK
jgi:hypothetical protein